MDCEKFESNLIDELYGELDDVTSAAMKRHAAGCSRCAGLLGGLKATRKVAALPMEPLPDGLEDRILAAAREAQKVVPMRSRFATFVSRAGAWAMRPQTAMAAVFLLAIGSSVVLMNTSRSRDAAPAGVAVQTKGSPMDLPPAASGAEQALDRSDNAHGTLEPGRGRAAATAAPGLLEKDKFALSDEEKANADPNALSADGKLDRVVANAATPGGAPDTTTIVGGTTGASGFGGSGTGPAQQAYGSGGGTVFESAMGDYRAKNYDDATRRFDTLSANDANAALWAARSVRDGSGGCGAAVGRFDQVAARADGTPTGYEALLDAGRCYKQLGNYDAARARFAKLAGVPTYATRAQTELDSMSPAARTATKSAAPMPMKPMATATATATAPAAGAKPRAADGF